LELCGLGAFPVELDSSSRFRGIVPLLGDLQGIPQFFQFGTEIPTSFRHRLMLVSDNLVGASELSFQNGACGNLAGQGPVRVHEWSIWPG
jgi:hypothetical protein